MIQPDEIIRSNRKTISVCISPLGKITVRAPKRCDTGRIFAFLQEKEGWILRQKAKTAGAGMRLPTENLHGYTFLLLGKQRQIFLDDGKTVRFDEQTDTIYLPKSNAQTKLIQWLKTNAKRIFTQQTQRIARLMDCEYRSVSVTSAKTRWGSCSGNNALHYSFRLLYASKEVIEYVIIHELAHTRHKNHSKLFWQEVEKYCPQWKTHRAWLKQNAIVMEIF